MNRTLAIVIIALVSIALGYVLVRSVHTMVEPEVPAQDPQVMEKEVKQMIMFMNPAITEEIARNYLNELKKLNESYGYTPGGNPKGDIETMRTYAEKVEAIQQKYNIVPSGSVEVKSGFKKPALSPQKTDRTYMPPSGVRDAATASVAGGNPKLQPSTSQKAEGPTADPESAASRGGPASTPPLIKQENIPPAPPLPPMMSTE